MEGNASATKNTTMDKEKIQVSKQEGRIYFGGLGTKEYYDINTANKQSIMKDLKDYKMHIEPKDIQKLVEVYNSKSTTDKLNVAEINESIGNIDININYAEDAKAQIKGKEDLQKVVTDPEFDKFRQSLRINDTHLEEIFAQFEGVTIKNKANQPVIIKTKEDLKKLLPAKTNPSG
jgi:hypothetical protein